MIFFQPNAMKINSENEKKKNEQFRGYFSPSRSARVGTHCELYIKTEDSKTVNVKIWLLS